MTEKQLEKKILDSGRTLLFSNEDLKRLIIPLVIDQVLVRTVGMADTMMISSVGEAAISDRFPMVAAMSRYFLWGWRAALRVGR